MLGAIKYNLGHMIDFNGRDARTTYWYFVLFLFIIRFLVGIVVTVPMMAQVIGNTVQAAANGASPEAVQAQTMTAMVDSMSRMLWIGVVVGVVTGLMFLASVVRRLHDVGYSGWLAAVPGGMYAIGMALTPGQTQKAMESLKNLDLTKPHNPFFMIQGQSVIMLLTWIPVLMLLILGLLDSDGPNRFGEEPVNFR